MCDFYSLPGIRAVGVLNASDLPPSAPLMAVAGITVPVSVEPVWIPVGDSAKAVRTEVRTARSLSQTANLTFRSSLAIPRLANPAFVVIDQNGAQWLIMSCYPPFPKISESASSGLLGSEPADFSYEVTHTAVRTLFPCAVLYPDS